MPPALLPNPYDWRLNTPIEANSFWHLRTSCRFLSIVPVVSVGTSRLGWKTHGLKGLSLEVGGGLHAVLLPESLLWAAWEGCKVVALSPPLTSFTSAQLTVSL